MPNPNRKWGLPPKFDNIPAAMRRTSRWVLWTAKKQPNGKMAKQPRQPGGRLASIAKPDDWSSFDDVMAEYLLSPGDYNGVGFVMTGMKKKLTFLDLDNCRDPKKGMAPWAEEIVQAADSYTEISPSGTGVRIIAYEDLGAFINNEQGLEVYTNVSKRYVTITGHIYKGKKEIRAISDKLKEAVEDYRPLERANTDASQEPIKENAEWILETLKPLVKAKSRYEHYDDWLRLGMALHHQFDGGPEGHVIWDTLSQQLLNYEPSDLEYKYSTFTAGGHGVTLRSTLKEAKEAGISIKPAISPADFPDLDNEPEEAYFATPDDWLLTGEQMVKAPVPRQLVEDLLARKQISMITGPPGAGKSFLALHMAMCVARGDKMFGLRVDQGNVVYLSYEGLTSLQQRARALEAQDRTWPASLMAGQPDVSLGDIAWNRKLGEKLKPLEPSLIIIDTLAAAMPGRSSSSEEDMSKIMSDLRAWATKWNCHIAVIHHPTKGENGSKVRGSGVIEGDLDTLIWVEKDTATHVVVADVAKQRSMGSFGFQMFYRLVGCVTTGESQWVDGHGQVEKEKSAYLTEDVSPSMRMDPLVLDLRERLRMAINEAGGAGIDAGAWVTLREDWIGSQERFRAMSEGSVKNRIKTVLHEISDEFDLIRSGNNRVIRVETRR